MKRKLAAVLIAVTILGMTGCQKNPDSSIVKNKDFDNMIHSAQNTESGTSNVAEMAGNYDTYKTTLKDDTLGVTVDVDAKVDIPNADKMSVIRVQQKEIDKELLDRVKDTLLAGEKLYDGGALGKQTKKSIEQQIQEWKNELAAAEQDMAPEDFKSYQQEVQKSIDELEGKYEAAPADVSLTDHPSDGKLHTAQEYLQQDPDNDYYLGQKQMNENGTFYYGCNDGADGTYDSLYVQNNANYGNCLRYRRSKTGYMKVNSVAVSSRMKDETLGLWKASTEPSEEDILIADYGQLKELEHETATLPMEDARQQADDLLKELGLSDYAYSDGDLYCEVTDTANWKEEIGYRKEYIFQYFRNVDGVLADNYGSSKFVDEWQGDNYRKQEWPPERVVVYVNDDGIVGLDYMAPLKTTETVVDKASMKTFDEVKDIFEQMIVVTQAMDKVKVDLKVDRVVLRYMRISEENSFDTGLLVPVWDFLGTRSEDYGGAKMDRGYNSLLTINAIDGSVIDKELGY